MTPGQPCDLVSKPSGYVSHANEGGEIRACLKTSTIPSPVYRRMLRESDMVLAYISGVSTDNSVMDDRYAK